MTRKFEWFPEYKLSGGVDRWDAYTTGPFGLELHVQRCGKEWIIWGPGRWPDYDKLTEIHPNRKSAIKEAERYVRQELKDWGYQTVNRTIQAARRPTMPIPRGNNGVALDWEVYQIEDRLHNLERKIKLVSDAAAELQKSVCGSYNPNRYTVSKKKFIELLARIEIAEEAKEAEHE